MQGEAAETRATKKPARRTAGLKAPLIASAGGLMTAAALVAVLGREPAANSDFKLSIVAPGEITVAAATLAPEWSAQITAQAKNCSVPMAFVTIDRQTGKSGRHDQDQIGCLCISPLRGHRCAATRRYSFSRILSGRKRAPRGRGRGQRYHHFALSRLAHRDAARFAHP